LPHQGGGDYAGELDFVPIFMGVPAVHISPGQIDDHIRAVETLDPVTKVFGIPMSALPFRANGMARNHRYGVATFMEMSREYVPDLARSTRNYNSKGRDRRHSKPF